VARINRCGPGKRIAASRRSAFVTHVVNEYNMKRSAAVGSMPPAEPTGEPIIPMNTLPIRSFIFLFHRGIRIAALTVAASAALCAAQSKPPADNPEPDVLVLANGDTLHGKFLSATAGKVTFHCEPLGDISLSWDKIKELHATGQFGVLNQSVALRGKHRHFQFPVGKIDVADQQVTVHPENGPAPAPTPVKNAQYIMDSATLEKEINHEPSFLAGWNGAATAGATLVSATSNQYTFTGAVNLIRSIPGVTWLDPRNKTIVGFNEAYGKITQPAYSYPATPPATGSIAVPAIVTKSSIFHLGAERDEYFSPRVYALAQTAFDHNYAQDLQLQQIYGGGFGWTVVKAPRQELDLKGTLQYEEQQFVPGSGNVNQNLIGSTFAANYVLHLKLLALTQAVSFIPAYNRFSAYSASETNTVTFPTYKKLGFSLGTVDTYLNDAPFTGTSATPPTRPNSFQFTMGLTYAFKSSY
jgi:hypothetical protein